MESKTTAKNSRDAQTFERGVRRLDKQHPGGHWWHYLTPGFADFTLQPQCSHAQMKQKAKLRGVMLLQIREVPPDWPGCRPLGCGISISF